MPQEIIELPAPELTGANAEQFEIIDYKNTVRLAQQPGSYTVLIYRRPVVGHKRDHGEEDEVAFMWSTSRGHRHAVGQLKGFSGTLLTDGYSAYEKAAAALNEQEVSVTHAACWAHGRRALEKALAMDPESAQQGLNYIAALYAIERKLRHGAYDAAAKLAYRQQYSEPIVNDFFSWVYDQRQRVDLLPSNTLSKGLHTISERQTELKVFLSAP